MQKRETIALNLTIEIRIKKKRILQKKLLEVKKYVGTVCEKVVRLRKFYHTFRFIFQYFVTSRKKILHIIKYSINTTIKHYWEIIILIYIDR